VRGGYSIYFENAASAKTNLEALFTREGYWQITCQVTAWGNVARGTGHEVRCVGASLCHTTISVLDSQDKLGPVTITASTFKAYDDLLNELVADKVIGENKAAAARANFQKQYPGFDFTKDDSTKKGFVSNVVSQKEGDFQMIRASLRDILIFRA